VALRLIYVMLSKLLGWMTLRPDPRSPINMIAYVSSW
jgi:hypothetical protein